MPSIVGYARTSTHDQVAGLEAQKRDLLAAGCQHICAEQVSSVAERGELNRALAMVGPGDTLVVTKPDRLARSTAALLTIEADLSRRDVGLIVLSMGGQKFDTRNPTAKLILTILAGVATWEREIMLERQREGIAKAKADGKYAARNPAATAMADSVRILRESGEDTTGIATKFGISDRHVRRLLKAAKPHAVEHIAQSGAVFPRPSAVNVNRLT